MTEKFTEFKSVHPKGPNNAQGSTYGIVGDKDGNGYWTQMAFDTIVKANLATGETTELKLPPVKDEMARATAADMKFYNSMARATSARRSRGRKDRAAWASTAKTGCCGWRIPGAARWHASTPRPCRRR